MSALLARAANEFDCRLLTWDAETLLPAGFDAVTRARNGDVREAWGCLRWAELVVVVTSFNVRLLARLAEEYLRTQPTPALTVVQTSGHSLPDTAATAQQEGWLRGLMALSHTTVAVSEAVRSALTSLYDGQAAPPRTVVIENAARLRAPAGAMRQRARTNVSFIGRPYAQKGYPLFIRLVDDLAGSGLRFFANTVTMPPPFEHPGVKHSWLLDDDRLRGFFDTTDLLVAPYLHADGLPLALLEALNCGVPVLGFDSPAVAPLLRRFEQPVIAPDYAVLRNAVESWHSGGRTIRAPAPGLVPSWDEQYARYASLIRAAGRSQR